MHVRVTALILFVRCDISGVVTMCVRHEGPSRVSTECYIKAQCVCFVGVFRIMSSLLESVFWSFCIWGLEGRSLVFESSYSTQEKSSCVVNPMLCQLF